METIASRLMLPVKKAVKADKPLGRVEAFDALRGLNMLFIGGMSAVVAAACTKDAAGISGWLWMQTKHVNWSGLHINDLWFPIFIFVSGASFPFSRRNSMEKDGPVVGKAMLRCLLLILCGLVYNGLLQSGPGCRVASVLARIGTSWFIAAMLYHFVRRRWVRLLLAAAVLVGYWLFMLYVPVPGAGTASFTPTCNWAAWLDINFLPNHKIGLWTWNADPEGLVSILPAAVIGVLGVECGDLIMRCREGGFSCRRMLTGFVAAGAGLVALGLLWQMDFPVIKKIWSSSFVCIASGIGFLAVALFYLLADVWKCHKSLFVLKVVGMNAIVFYMLRRIVNFGGIRDFFFRSVFGLLPASALPVLNPLAEVFLCWCILYLMYRRKWFVKI